MAPDAATDDGTDDRDTPFGEPCPHCGGTVLTGVRAQEERAEVNEIEVEEIRPWGQDAMLWVACVQCDTVLWKADDPEPDITPPGSEETISVPASALVTIMEFIRDDPAMDTAPAGFVEEFERLEKQMPEEYHPRFYNPDSWFPSDATDYMGIVDDEDNKFVLIDYDARTGTIQEPQEGGETQQFTRDELNDFFEPADGWETDDLVK